MKLELDDEHVKIILELLCGTAGIPWNQSNPIIVSIKRQIEKAAEESEND